MNAGLTSKCGIAILALAVFASGCSYKVDKGGDAKATLLQGQTLSFSVIRDVIIAPKCFQCHLGSGGQGGLDLSTYTSLVANRMFVAGDPANSDIFIQVNSGQMPFGQAKLSAIEIQAIHDWIEQGALEN